MSSLVFTAAAFECAVGEWRLAVGRLAARACRLVETEKGASAKGAGDRVGRPARRRASPKRPSQSGAGRACRRGAGAHGRGLRAQVGATVLSVSLAPAGSASRRVARARGLNFPCARAARLFLFRVVAFPARALSLSLRVPAANNMAGKLLVQGGGPTPPGPTCSRSRSRRPRARTSSPAGRRPRPR